jgi:hypothetical protein
VGDSLENWFQSMSAGVVVKAIVNAQVVETVSVINIQAVRQPLSARQLEMKPEGQRGWNWEMLHVKAQESYTDGTTLVRGTNFNLDDILLFGSKQYRIKLKNEFGEFGYFEYHIVEQFTTGGLS